MHVPQQQITQSLLYMYRYSSDLMCLKTPPPAGGFAMIGYGLSHERIMMFASLAESSNSIFRPSMEHSW